MNFRDKPSLNLGEMIWIRQELLTKSFTLNPAAAVRQKKRDFPQDAKIYLTNNASLN